MSTPAGVRDTPLLSTDISVNIVSSKLGMNCEIHYLGVKVFPGRILAGFLLPTPPFMLLSFLVTVGPFAVKAFALPFIDRPTGLSGSRAVSLFPVAVGTGTFAVKAFVLSSIDRMTGLYVTECRLGSKAVSLFPGTVGTFSVKAFVPPSVDRPTGLSGSKAMSLFPVTVGTGTFAVKAFALSSIDRLTGLSVTEAPTLFKDTEDKVSLTYQIYITN